MSNFQVIIQLRDTVAINLELICRIHINGQEKIIPFPFQE